MKVTFIIPTIGRDTLPRTLRSLLDQTDGDWDAIVLADVVPDFKLSDQDPRIWAMNLRHRKGTMNHAGKVRNIGMAMAAGEWIAFVDDDDRLDIHYVEWLREEGKDSDVVIFKMKYPGEDGHIVPNGEAIEQGNIGISFAVRDAFLSQRRIWFENGQFEDWALIKACSERGARIKFSDKVAYFVRH